MILLLEALVRYNIKVIKLSILNGKSYFKRKTKFLLIFDRNHQFNILDLLMKILIEFYIFLLQRF